MSQILVETDPQIKHPEIVLPLQRTSIEEVGQYYDGNQVEIQQTSLHGIVAPLIQINNTVIDYDKVVDFSLKGTGLIPTVSLTVIDSYNLISQFDTPTNDNSLCIQILPPFENAYKKINLEFYIDSIRTSRDGYVSLTGTYKLASLIESRLQCFGQISTKQLFQLVTQSTGLGLASNYTTELDQRYIYCAQTSYLDLLQQEIGRGGSEVEVLDWWIDWWEYINLANVYERYLATDKNEDLLVWVNGQQNEVTEGINHIPIQISATLTNLPNARGTDLYILEYYIKNKSGMNRSRGTDRSYGIYSENIGDYSDTLVQDGDIKSDIFIKHEYLGELYGDYNYMIMPAIRDAFLQKMQTETLEVDLQSPVLGLMRGHRVNVQWYINDSNWTQKMESLAQKDVLGDAKDDILAEDNTPGNWVLDQSISGQYLIIGNILTYTEKRWIYKLILSRPSTSKKNVLVNTTNTNQNETTEYVNNI